MSGVPQLHTPTRWLTSTNMAGAMAVALVTFSAAAPQAWAEASASTGRTASAPASCAAPSLSMLEGALARAVASSPAATGATAAPAPGLGVTCAIPFSKGKPGSDCTGTHDLIFTTTGTSANAKITAELLGLALDGSIIQALPVKSGESAHMASRVNPADFKMSSKGLGAKRTHEVFAPIPMLRIVVEDQGQKVEA